MRSFVDRPSVRRWKVDGRSVHCALCSAGDVTGAFSVHPFWEGRKDQEHAPASFSRIQGLCLWRAFSEGYTLVSVVAHASLEASFENVSMLLCPPAAPGTTWKTQAQAPRTVSPSSILCSKLCKALSMPSLAMCPGLKPNRRKPCKDTCRSGRYGLYNTWSSKLGSHACAKLWLSPAIYLCSLYGLWRELFAIGSSLYRGPSID